jgi:hypothetical protein
MKGHSPGPILPYKSNIQRKVTSHLVLLCKEEEVFISSGHWHPFLSKVVLV